MKESQIVTQLIKALNLSEFIVTKIVGESVYQAKGLPDIIGCYMGRFIGLEVKFSTGKYSKLQIEWLKDLQKHGAFAVGIFYDPDFNFYWMDQKLDASRQEPFVNFKQLIELLREKALPPR